jgi:hypothetical protein
VGDIPAMTSNAGEEIRPKKTLTLVDDRLTNKHRKTGITRIKATHNINISEEPAGARRPLCAVY